MVPLELTQTTVEILVAVCLGLLGAVTRIFTQYHRDGELPSDGLGLYTESFLGAMAGFISWLFVQPIGLRGIAIGALTAGFAGVDFVENMLAERDES